MTAPLTGLWEAKAPVTCEDVAHMKSRITNRVVLQPEHIPIDDADL